MAQILDPQFFTYVNVDLCKKKPVLAVLAASDIMQNEPMQSSNSGSSNFDENSGTISANSP